MSSASTEPTGPTSNTACTIGGDSKQNGSTEYRLGKGTKIIGSTPLTAILVQFAPGGSKTPKQAREAIRYFIAIHTRREASLTDTIESFAQALDDFDSIFAKAVRDGLLVEDSKSIAKDIQPPKKYWYLPKSWR
jgi:hypothetical protein